MKTNEDPKPILCSQCGGMIGVYESGPDGRVWLRLDGSGLLVRDMNAIHQCGQVWNFHTSDKALEDLLQRARDNHRKATGIRLT